MVKYAPMGDPMELRIHSYELTLRLADADKIEIENVRDAGEKGETSKKNNSHSIPHPGLGEGGKFHFKETENPLPDSEMLTFALAGNQNCGKTTLFNQLTGSSSMWEISQVLLWTERTDRSWKKQYPGNRSSGNLFHVSVFQRRNRNKEFCTE